jgi:hypothetical protein
MDITERVIEAARQLEKGQMITSERFSLDDAMSAIELMEPKMDPGFDILRKEYSSQEIRNRIVSADLSDEGSRRVADSIMFLVLQWLKGHLFIQTVQSSLFVVERESLLSSDISSLSNETLAMCKSLRSFISSAYLSDEEDFVGYMFGFDEDLVENMTVKPPRIYEGNLSAHHEFLSELSNLLQTNARSLDEDLSRLDRIVTKLQTLSSQSASAGLLCEAEETLIKKSVDPTLHRNLLPPGPPRSVPVVTDIPQMYEEWMGIFQCIRDGVVLFQSLDISSGRLSPFKLVTTLCELRRDPRCRFALTRAFLHRRIISEFKPVDVITSWLTALCGGKLPRGTKGITDEVDAFVNDSALVIQRVVYLLFRSPARQHRALKSTLSDLCVMQHRAWAIHTKVQDRSSQGLWIFTCSLACSLIELNFVLSIELGLVDFDTMELPIVMSLLEAVAGVRTYVLNDAMGIMRNGKNVNADIAREVQNETVVAALEHSLIETTLRTVSQLSNIRGLDGKLTEGQRERIFELRSIPLQTFPLPKNLSLDECLGKIRSYTGDAGADECLGWVDRVSQVHRDARGIILGSDISAVKRTVLNNKLMLIKARQDGRLALKYHTVIPCIVTGTPK